MRNSLNWTQSDAIAEAVSAESCHIVLNTPPIDYVQKISRYLESSVGQSRQDNVSGDNAEAESDSGDSLFITQKPVPEAVRTGRRHHYSLRSQPTFPRYLEESGDDTSSSDYHGKSRTDEKRTRKKFKLPKYSFPFLRERKGKPRSTLLFAKQNKRLHTYATGGFFKCVRELWQGYQRDDDLLSSLPTLDIDRTYISPLSEEERSEDEDIKVVAKKHFVAPSKSKCSQLWYAPEKMDIQVQQQRRRRRTSTTRQETSQAKQSKIFHKISSKMSISRPVLLPSDIESSDDGDPSCSVLAERETRDKCVTSDRSILAQTETSTRTRRLTRAKKAIIFQRKEREEELCSDSDATVCEPLKLHESPSKSAQKGREPSTTVSEAQTDAFHIDDPSQTQQAEDEPENQSLLQSLPDLLSDTNNDKICSATKIKKKKKKEKSDNESVEEGKGQGHEKPEGQHVATSVNVEAGETPFLAEGNRAKPLALQTGDELELSKNNWMENLSYDDNILRWEERDSPDSKTVKKKRKKNKSTAENVKQDVEVNVESGVRVEDSFNMEDSIKKKKKKKKRSAADEEDAEQLQSSPVAEPLNDDTETQRRRKKRKKEKRIVIPEEHEEEQVSNIISDLPPVPTEEQLEETGNSLENTEALQETIEYSYKKKRKKHKKKQQSFSNDATQVGAEDNVDVHLSNGAVTLEGHTGMYVKKKKKRRENIFEEADISYTPDKNNKVENARNFLETRESLDDQDAQLVARKKKKREKVSETCSRHVSEDTVAQSDQWASVRKREKKRTPSSLTADSEEKRAQSHKEQNSSSEAVAAQVSSAEKPGVSADDFQTESAEIARNSSVGVRKKKRKKKKNETVNKDHEPDFQTHQSALSESTDTGVKKKKKRKRTESESMTFMDELDSAADAGHSQSDEAVALKKKCHVIQESPSTATEDTESERATVNTISSVSQKKKGKYGHNTEISHGSSICDRATKDTLNVAEHALPSSETPGSRALNDTREKKKKKKTKATANVLLEGKLLTKSAETEASKSKKKPAVVPSFTSNSPVLSETSLTSFEMSSTGSSRATKQQKAKRRLYNPNGDFLTDF
uniref:phoenix n=1 Tax=Monopterus albus TaxID=43700 RepID=UPI0009B4DB6D|nr:uncharacterized protein LOC109960458 [Monopterus albus]